MKETILTKIAAASKGAVKDFLGMNVSSSINLHPTSSRGSNQLPTRNWLFNQGDSNLDISFSYTGLADIKVAYECCPLVYSIVNQQAYSISNGKTWVMGKNGKEAKGEWADKVRKLMKQPNPLQNWKQFESQLVIYIRLFGFVTILPIKPKGYGNEDAEALWIIPPYLLEFEFNDEAFYMLKEKYIKRIIIKYGSEEKELPADDLIFLKDITPGFSNVYLPGSPIKPLKQSINNLISILESKGMLITYRGALGILTPEIDPSGAIPNDPQGEEDIGTKLMNYGLLQGQRKIIVATTAMKWQQIGIPYKDLMLTEWAADEAMNICDGLNFPFRLAANTSSSSLSGGEIDSWKKKLYDDFSIPFSGMIYEQLSESFNAEANKAEIIKDFSDVKILQEDDAKTAQGRLARNNALQIEFQNNMITLNRWLEINNEDEMKNGMGDKYYWELLKEGWVFGGGGMTLQINQPNQNNPEANATEQV